MRISKIFLSLLAAVLLGSSFAQARNFTPIDPAKTVVCPVVDDQLTPPDFAGENCRSAAPHDIDPQGTHLWVKTGVFLENTRGANGEPLSIYVSGKMASEAYLNGVLVGANGAPAENAVDEIAGEMDAIFHPDQSLFQEGDNDIVLRLSAHHGFLKLSHPVHTIGIGVTTGLGDSILRHYWPSLITLGLFIAGAIYFGVTAVLGAHRRKSITLSLMSAFAAAQLIAEVSRGLFGYSYPLHDLRLVLITCFSGGFGLSIAHYIFGMFDIRPIGRSMAMLAAVTIIGVLLVRGFDQKALVALLAPLSVSLITAAYFSYRRKAGAFVIFLALLAFAAAIFMFPNNFLDVVFYYCVAALLVFLFVNQGVIFVHEARQRRFEEARANRLSLALEQAREREETSVISVKSAGEIIRIPTDQIIHCRGAGGYVELFLKDGRSYLHSASLTELEDALPGVFLRIHRSHLVNSGSVKSIKRDPAGTGTLQLIDGTELPVSRRVLPSVRQALA